MIFFNLNFISHIDPRYVLEVMIHLYESLYIVVHSHLEYQTRFSDIEERDRLMLAIAFQKSRRCHEEFEIFP